MVLTSDIALLGDTINTWGIIRDLSLRGPVSVIIPQESKWFYELLSPTIKLSVKDDTKYSNGELNLTEAFIYGSKENYHMSQCYHAQFNLPTPKKPIRPELNVPDIEVPIYDYILAPFSRSLPEEQKWGLHRWQELSWKLNQQGFTTCVFGNSKYDPQINGMQMEYDRPMNEVLNMIKKCRKGVVSVVTGISHLAYAMEAQNILLSGQGNSGWGINPDAFVITGRVNDFTVEQVLRVINENRL